jgi:hypothetical protein
MLKSNLELENLDKYDPINQLISLFVILLSDANCSSKKTFILDHLGIIMYKSRSKKYLKQKLNVTNESQ